MESYPTNSPRRIFQRIYIRGLPANKTNNFFLEMVFIHGISMCEGVGEDSRHGIGNVDIRVGIMNSLECVCFSIA